LEEGDKLEVGGVVGKTEEEETEEEEEEEEDDDDDDGDGKGLDAVSPFSLSLLAIISPRLLSKAVPVSSTVLQLASFASVSL
jgi:pyruvate/2-oxoglutarate dehydrogenase complex dihydrolipoamide acyltransferase (E2) component